MDGHNTYWNSLYPNDYQPPQQEDVVTQLKMRLAALRSSIKQATQCPEVLYTKEKFLIDEIGELGGWK